MRKFSEKTGWCVHKLFTIHSHYSTRS